MPDGTKGFTLSGVTAAAADADDKRPQRERIIDAVIGAGVTFWQDNDAFAFATVPCDITDPDGAVMHVPVRRRRFALICRKLFGLANPVAGQCGDRPGSLSDHAMREAIPAFEAMALAGDDVRQPSIRLSDYCGAIWIDIGDQSFRAIRVTADGWTIVKRAEAPLIRSDGLRALPTPVRADDALGQLRRLLNIADDDEGSGCFRLIVAWLVAALHPAGPYPLIALDGEQGSGKTTTARMLRKLVDPNAADLRAMPRNEDDLLIAASNGRVIACDNVSFIDELMADALCRVATGAGFGKRTLFTDIGETILSVTRPVLLNGIPSLLSRGDLADRSIAITLPPIPDEKRRPESKVWADFDAAAPGILALLLDALATALRRLPTLKLDRLPRMADFARLACAAAPAFSWTAGEMLAAMDTNRITAIETVVESDPIAGAVRAILSDNPSGWTGTASLLLEAVNERVPNEVKNERGWPKDATRLATRLKRVSPALRRVGVEIETVREGHDRTRKTIIRPLSKGKTASAASAASAGHHSNELVGAPVSSNGASVRTSVRSKPLETNDADTADAKDAAFPTLKQGGMTDGDVDLPGTAGSFANGDIGPDEVIL